MEIGLVKRINIDDEMQQAYLDYAMSVIVARALPDARDGLKPVQRRILYAMYDMGLRANTPYKKSARIVGEVLGKYHPHGDMAVYDAMSRMAQDFSMRNLLVDGQGNFGSIDGDPPAAMRYTEARLAALAEHILEDIQKNTVDFGPNFDGTMTEPEVLPAALPNLLVNGATGIAVGMATSIPPHNLGEVIDALVYLLERWEKMDDVSITDLMQFVKGPDFPTGGIIIHEEGEDESLESAYAKGRGRVTVQARVSMEEMTRGRNRLIVTELPYMTNKASLIERIAGLVRDERLDGISDLRDESDRQGMRVVIELSKTADPDKVLRDLYKSTPMRSTFSIILLALVDGEPRMLSLKQALRVYIEHRLTVIRRRSQYDLDRAKHRAHILEGLLVALKNLDAIIALIRKAPDADTARDRLMKQFKLTEIQAQAILDMQLRRLAALERKKIEQEYKEVQETIKHLEGLLRSPKKMRQVAAEELLKIKEKYADARRTQIFALGLGETTASLLTTSDLIVEQPVWVAATADGKLYQTKDGKRPQTDSPLPPRLAVRATTRDILYLVGENGEAAAIPMHSIPHINGSGEGVAFHRISALRETDRLVAMFAAPEKADRQENHFILTCTRQGMLKKSSLGELPGASAQTFTLAKVNDGDRLGWVVLTDGQEEVLLLTAQGMAIRFKEEEVRPMGLVAAGVMGIKLQAKDEVTGMALAKSGSLAVLLAADGTGKRIVMGDFPVQGRYGQGVTAWKLPDETRSAALAVANDKATLTVFLEQGVPQPVRVADFPLQTRATRGKAVLKPEKEDRVVGLSFAWEAPWAGQPVEPAGQDPDGGEKPTKKTRDGKPAGKVAAAGKKPAVKKALGTAKTAAGKTSAVKKTVAKSSAKSAQPASGKKAVTKAAGGTAKTAAGKTTAVKKTAAKSSAKSAQPASGKTATAKASGGTAPAPAKPAVKSKKTAASKPAAEPTLFDLEPAAKQTTVVKPAATRAKTPAAAPAKPAGKSAARSTKDTEAPVPIPKKMTGTKAKAAPAAPAPETPAPAKKTGSKAATTPAKTSPATGKPASGSGTTKTPATSSRGKKTSTK